MSTYRPPLVDELAVRVRARLTENGLTQAVLARRVGATEKHVSRVLNGRDDGSIPFWDALIRESGYEREPDEPGNRRHNVLCELRDGAKTCTCWGPSQTSTQVNALMNERAPSTSAQPRPSGAGSSSSPSVAPADTASEARGQQP